MTSLQTTLSHKNNQQPQSVTTDNFYLLQSFGNTWCLKSIERSDNWLGDGHYREFVDGFDNALARARELSELIYGVK